MELFYWVFVQQSARYRCSVGGTGRKEGAVEEYRMATRSPGDTNGHAAKQRRPTGLSAWLWLIGYSGALFLAGHLVPKLFEVAGRCFGG